MMLSKNKKKKKSKARLWKFFLIPVLAVAVWYGIFSIPGFETNPYSPRYMGWKLGVLPYPSGTIHATISLDQNRDGLVADMSFDDLVKRFPDAHPEPSTSAQQEFEDESLGGVRHLWLGDSDLVIILEGGKGKKIQVTKS